MLTDWPQRIKDFRLAHQCSQLDLAQCLGVSIKTLQTWEQGHTKPPEYLNYALRYLSANPLLIIAGK